MCNPVAEFMNVLLEYYVTEHATAEKADSVIVVAIVSCSISNF